MFLLLETGMLGVCLFIGSISVLLFLGNHAPADVFLNRHLGRPPARVRGD